uniref:Uncharacterized protein n=1 Tax=Romanomermis culicivorax TaxID=13658 RepID=A0A915LAF8_ROMCU
MCIVTWGFAAVVYWSLAYAAHPSTTTAYCYVATVWPNLGGRITSLAIPYLLRHISTLVVLGIISEKMRSLEKDLNITFECINLSNDKD